MDLPSDLFWFPLPIRDLLVFLAGAYVWRKAKFSTCHLEVIKSRQRMRKRIVLTARCLVMLMIMAAISDLYPHCWLGRCADASPQLRHNAPTRRGI